MTPKELLYIEDVLDHGQQMKIALNDFEGQLTDPELKNFVKTLSDKKTAEYEKFYSLF